MSLMSCHDITNNNYECGIIMPFENFGELEDVCCIYSPKLGFNVYEEPNGKIIGKLQRNVHSKNFTESENSLYLFDNEGKSKTEIDLNKLPEIGYEIWSINYVERNEGFVRIIDSTLNLWISEKEIQLAGFALTNWQTFILDNTDILLGFYANEPGINLMTEATRKSEKLKTLKGDNFDIRPTGEEKGNWNKVRVIKTKEHPCGSDLTEEENYEYRIEGWIEMVDKDGNPNVWYYSRGC